MIKWNDETKRYELENGGFMSSPSRMLRPITTEIYKDIPERYLEMAREFGETIHNAMMMHSEIGEQEALDTLYSVKEKQTFNKYLKFLEDNEFEVIETEKLVWNTKARYYGYIDIVAKKDGNTYLIDLKTRSNLKSSNDFLAEKLQGMFYEEAFASMQYENKELTGDIIPAVLVINKNTKTTLKFIVDYKTKELERVKNALITTNLALINYEEDTNV